MLFLLVTILLGLDGSQARVATPAVYSYSSSLNSKHPAYITHHYVQPETTTNLIYAQENETIQPIEHNEEAEVPSHYEKEGQPPLYHQDYPAEKVLQSPRQFAYSDRPKETHVEELADEKYAKGAGQQYNSKQKSLHGAKKAKDYEGKDKYFKHLKGHHIKEDHKGRYKDAKGKKGKKNIAGNNYKEQHHAEKGRKAAKFGESGGHKKGHQTMGKHKIHKKNEYSKKHEYYDEHHEGDEHEKHGGYHGEHFKKKGSSKRKGHHKSAHKKGKIGKKGSHDKGKESSSKKGHKETEVHEAHYKQFKKHGKKANHNDDKHWTYSKKHR